MYAKILFLVLCLFTSSQARAEDFWLELKAENKQDRNKIVNAGFDIVSVEPHQVIVLASEEMLAVARKKDWIISSYSTRSLSPYSFPKYDQEFHDYSELTVELKKLALAYPDILTLESMGQSFENRELWHVRLSAQTEDKDIPAALFVGGHHAREHVSVEVPLRLIQYIAEQYQKKNPRIVSLLTNFEVHIIPLLNPDGSDFDVSTGSYRSWRKNRRLNSDKSFGVDLNRNYDSAWGTTGTSSNPRSDTYRGPSAFSEPETVAFKKFMQEHPQISNMISYHTFGQDILWPWSYTDQDITNKKDLLVFKTMAQKMSQLSGYVAMKSGDMYLSSGDTCDWAYSAHGVFAFTFELDPGNMSEGGFYPAQSELDGIFTKNIESALYLIESSDNPYKVLLP